MMCGWGDGVADSKDKMSYLASGTLSKQTDLDLLHTQQTNTMGWTKFCKNNIWTVLSL